MAKELHCKEFKDKMVEISGLYKYYGKFCAVEGLDLSIEKGEIVALLGPNGAGKSTTLRILTGCLCPTRGRVAVAGFSMAERPQEFRKKIGYLPENSSLYPEMRVIDYLGFFAQLRLNASGLPLGPVLKADVEEALDACSLREVEDLRCHKLSKGYRQRVALAAAMVTRPELLVLDEPSSGLDPRQRVEMRSMVRGLVAGDSSRSCTVVLSTHTLAEAAELCSRAVIMSAGKIVAEKQLMGEGAGGNPSSVSELEQLFLESISR